MKLVISSKNPVKVNATLGGFKQMFPEETFEHEMVAVSSGVSDQPMSNEETYLGATNRANNAKQEMPDADYWIGLEGGIEEGEKGMEAFAWAVVINKEGLLGKSRTATFFLPQRIAELVNQGTELGHADDMVFGTSNSKQSSGSVGILTKDVLTRTTYYQDAIVLALIPFKNPDLY